VKSHARDTNVNGCVRDANVKSRVRDTNVNGCVRGTNANSCVHDTICWETRIATGGGYGCDTEFILLRRWRA
jgi:hypothetical protein